MSPRPGRLGILTVITRKRVASAYRARIFSGRLEPCIAAGGHVHPRPRRSPRVRALCAENDRRQSKWDPGSHGAITSVACRAKTKPRREAGQWMWNGEPSISGRTAVGQARFLASAALCRYSFDRDDMQGE